MKAVHLFTSYLPTTENWCYRMLKNLPGTELLVVAKSRDNEGAFPLPGARFIIAPHIKYDPGLPWIVRKARGAIRRAANYFWRRELVKGVTDADLLHAHFSVVAWDYRWLADRTGLPMVVSFYGYDYERLPKSDPSWHDRYRELFSKASLFIAEGDAGRDKLVAMGCPPGKARVAHLGVELASIPFVGRKKVSGELLMVQVATFIEKKGHDTTVRAFARAAVNHPGMTLTLVGRDPEGIRKRVEDIVREGGVEDRVTILDGIDFSGLYRFLAGFHVFVHPSRYAPDGDSEGGAPIVLLDAQATGMPVISTTHCDIPGEVIDGVTGTLVAEDDVQALSMAMERFCLMEDEEYQGYAKRARAHVESNFDVVKCAERLKALYEEMLGTNG